MEAFRVLKYPTVIEKRPDASAQWVNLVRIFCALRIIEPLFDNRIERRNAFSIGEHANSPAPLFKWAKIVQIEFGEGFRQCLTEFILVQVLARQCDFGIVVASAQ